MHRSLLPSRIFVSLVLALVTAGSPLAVAGGTDQAPAGRRDALPPRLPETPATRGTNLVVPIGSSQRLQMRDRKVIQSVVNPKDNIATVQPIQDDPRTVLITGREAGMTRITLTAADGSQETYDVLVQLDIEFLRTLLL